MASNVGLYVLAGAGVLGVTALALSGSRKSSAPSFVVGKAYRITFELSNDPNAIAAFMAGNADDSAFPFTVPTGPKGGEVTLDSPQGATPKVISATLVATKAVPFNVTLPLVQITHVQEV